jgi:2-oxoglutarate dehydrogenase complex dehydrogenase (E1) component-like enzyme
MNTAQRMAVASLVRDGFKVTAKGQDVVRVTNGADKRIVLPCGLVKRANHIHYQERKIL